ncbi:hypothetical protein FKM82_013033 [Ascaphus truei]
MLLSGAEPQISLWVTSLHIALPNFTYKNIYSWQGHKLTLPPLIHQHKKRRVTIRAQSLYIYYPGVSSFMKTKLYILSSGGTSHLGRKITI